MMRIIRWILLPFSLLYALIVWLRNRFYDIGILKSQSFPLPIVVIGNLAVGGTGKSPMTEHILRLISPLRNIAVLSRGYGRKTKGFRKVEVSSTAGEVGDEPLQIKRKFPQNTVVVCEDRCIGIEKIRRKHEGILLDDAFQHRKLRPSFSILLFDFASLQHVILPLPTGNFRDCLHESKRADLVVITKCPNKVDGDTRFQLQAKLHKYTQAPIFFSTIAYENPINDRGEQLHLHELQQKGILLITGIANPLPLLSHIEPMASSLKHIAYPDHHAFSASDIEKIKHSYDSIPTDNKLILTTEKDFQRLPEELKIQSPIFYIPIHQSILFNQDFEFENMVKRAFSC
ncbi:tetraacyldisaccharide 4'-kinase [Sphingobacterium wenxiniae]|uniref:Tetraacyldisaccharide 4'-kinase n=1 Tax=Sphingobacterium wenxiniae TaxID=683125 RepID=A0A1I6SBF6_9SPHI|nr:tetraacyldisaccharide 4'-kinase [Sphingobacterium wenxiniae]SFS74301.1 lipid-A-disaccharide kinase [Sphingobacterium wenxiniae]